MKRKEYVTPHIVVEGLSPEVHLAAGSFQSDEPGAKPGDMFEEDLEENEDFDNESYPI
ncbi:MAG: hypothetical protein ACFNVK_02945 [Prevotella sp.]|jgi:hypothetical protein